MVTATRPKLGKQPARHDPRTLLFAHYVDGAFPTPPPTSDWGHLVPAWPMMLNDSLGDCTCAAAGHMIQAWTRDAGKMFVPPDDAIRAAYEAVSGYDPATGLNDNGAVELDVLNFWRRSGIAGHKIAAFAALEPRNHAHVRAAIWLFGGCYLGLSLPASCENQRVWSVLPGGAHGRGAPGSWGGHAVDAVAFDDHGITVITWGERKRMTWAFWDAYCDEAYAVLSPDWFGPSKKAPSGFDLAALQKDLAAITR